jgi:hypothetical protein
MMLLMLFILLLFAAAVVGEEIAKMNSHCPSGMGIDGPVIWISIDEDYQ